MSLLQTTPSASGRRDRWLAGAVVLACMLAHALPYGWATITLDTARDLSAAWRIAGGEAVVRGPILNGTVHLGPLWFYLLAPVLALSKSQALTLVWVGLLAALKFPLALALGRDIGGLRLGVVLLLLLALPGWAGIGAVLPTHTVMVEAAVLAQMLLMLRLARGGSGGWWALLGLVGGLAMHAHPSALFIQVLLPAVLWARRRRLAGDVGWVALGVLAFVLPLLPMLGAEWRDGWPTLQRALSAAADGGTVVVPLAALEVLRGVFIDGPRVALGLHGSGVLVWLSWLPMALLGGAGALGYLRRGVPGERRLAASLLGALVLIALLLVLVRDFTPFYMALVLLPPGSLLLALGLVRHPHGAALAGLALLPILTGALVLVASARTGQARVDTARLSDLRSDTPAVATVALLPAWQLDELGSESCRSDTPVVLHGYLAVLQDASLGLAPELACGRPGRFVFSGPGPAGAEHWLGLPPALARELGLQQGRRWLDTPRRGVEPLWPPKSLPPADRLHYPHHRATDAPGQPVRLRLQSRGGSALVVTDLLFPYRVNRISQVLANGQPAQQLAESNVTAVWTCRHCRGERIDWEVRGSGNDPDVIDVVAVPLANADAAAGAPGAD